MTETTKNGKFLLPSPNFGSQNNNAPKFPRPHFLTPSGMTLLPREKQPPPMYGPHGATVPPKYFNKYHHQGQLQNHIAKEQKPQVERQYCEACDMELHSIEDMRRHRTQHEPCPVDGCKYRGHASVMDKHVIMLHSSGLFDKVKRLTTPEEIAAWRNERRKKFPTLANVLQKQAAKEERMRRGERLEANKNRFGKREDRMRPNDMITTTDVGEEPLEKVNKSQKNKHKKKRKIRKVKNNKDHNKPKEKTLEITEQEENEDENESFGVPRFRGTSKMLDYEHKIETNALSTLCMYESSSEEETAEDIDEKLENQTVIMTEVKENCNSSDEAPDEAPVERISNQITPAPKTQNMTTMVLDATTTTTTTKKSELKQVMVKKKFIRKSGLNYGKLHRRRQHTMLEKLLEHDIRHERNVLLQCVRFVVDNKFFGIGSKSTCTETQN